MEAINMPQKDGTGPMGQGPLTGRRLGPCGRGQRFGFGRGQGFGRGMRSGYGPGYGYVEPAPLTREEQRKVLARQQFIQVLS